MSAALQSQRLSVRSCSACGIERRRSFCALPRELRAVLDELRAAVSYERGDVVFAEGSPSHSVYIVCSGALKLLTASSSGKVLLTGFAMPGEMLGLPEAIGGMPYESSGVAADRSTVSVIPREMLLRFIHSYPPAAFMVTSALAEQYRNLQHEMRFLAFGGTSTERVARLFLESSSDPDDREATSVHIPAHVTHVELAESIAATRETVTRVLSGLVRRGLIRRGSDGTFVVDREHLRALLEVPAPITDEGDRDAPAMPISDLLVGVEPWRAS